ncbi:hypothetical protein [Paraburkholderia sp. Cpub6]|uniref:hypothetical protein n=1 Tax=Paraburkholderia sp. Cpub6 TaxID=2723094 RepID=UPI00160C2FA2|nr:hypothetical protein [Paraburkholderia sp. Cpub6]MBB5460243.1 hypothetical protein [Paraburkholderia sp. Cpub6]
MNKYFENLCTGMKCDAPDFNTSLLEDIRITSRDGVVNASFIIEGSALTNVQTKFSDDKIIVIPLFGKNADSIGNVESYFSCEVVPRPNGTRVSCIMLADKTVALASMAPHWADMSRNDEFHIIWLFDDDALLSSHEVNDDFYDELKIANAIANDHNPLTEEEVQAWQRVATQATYVGIFDYVDFCGN